MESRPEPRRLLDLRADRAWSIRRLAQEADVAPKTVLRLEAGEDVRLASVERIARALDVPPMLIAEYVTQRGRTERP